jgi:hypothetical protein
MGIASENLSLFVLVARMKRGIERAQERKRERERKKLPAVYVLRKYDMQHAHFGSGERVRVLNVGSS